MAPAMPGCPVKSSPSLRCRRFTASRDTAPVCSRRNERERQRVRQVNLGFQALRQHVPHRGGAAGTARRLSKVQTLQAALNYIRGLQELLQRAAEGSPEPGVEEGGSSSPDTGTEEEREGEEAVWFYNY